MVGGKIVKVRSTLKDVASVAGVSPTTVSLYLNGASQVCSDETAIRIRQAVSQLQYTRGLKALNALEPTATEGSSSRKSAGMQSPSSDFPYRGQSSKVSQEPIFSDTLSARPYSGRGTDNWSEKET